MAYLLFAAWQDRSRRQVVADARWLTRAATWVHLDPDGAWETMDLDAWAGFVQGIVLEREQPHPPSSPSVGQAVEALHRAYAFWHWAEPERFPYQPFPTTVKGRQRWSRCVTEVPDTLRDDIP